MVSKHGRWALIGLLCSIAAPAISAQPPVSSPARADAIADAALRRVYELTDLHWHKGEYNHLVNLDRVVVAGRPHEMAAYEDSGWLLWSMGKDNEVRHKPDQARNYYGRARSLYELGIRNNPNVADMYEELGKLYIDQLHDYKNGILSLELAVRRPGGSPRMGHILAHAYEHEGRNRDALALWTKLARKPDDDAARVNLARLRRKLKQGPASGR